MTILTEMMSLNMCLLIWRKKGLLCPNGLFLGSLVCWATLTVYMKIFVMQERWPRTVLILLHVGVPRHAD